MGIAAVFALGLRAISLVLSGGGGAIGRGTVSGVGDTRASCASEAGRTVDSGAGIVDALAIFWVTYTTWATEDLQAGVGLACSLDAALLLGAGHTSAGVGNAFAIPTAFASGAIDASAGCQALAVAAEGRAAAGPAAFVVEAGIVDTLTCSADFAFWAPLVVAIFDHTSTTATYKAFRAVDPGTRGDALSLSTNPARRATDGEAGIIFALSCRRDTDASLST